MKHLTSEDWASYLYEELPPEDKQEWTSHLEHCSDCRAELEKWQSIQKQLNRWQLPPSIRPDSIGIPYARWAIAAMALIGISFLFGYLSGARPPTTESIVAELRIGLQSDLLKAKEELVQTAVDSHSKSLHEIGAIRDHIETLVYNHTRETKSALLRLHNETSANANKFQLELETVALVAEGRYQLSQNQLSALGISPLPSAAHFSIQPISH